MILHFEIHVNGIKAARELYAALFGWKFHQVPDSDYHYISCENIGDNQIVSGAIMARNAPVHKTGSGPRGAILTIPVQNVDRCYAKALSLGGSEALPPTDDDGAGRIAYFEDGQGNLFGISQPVKGSN